MQIEFKQYEDEGHEGFQLLDDGNLVMNFEWWDNDPTATTYKDAMEALPLRLKGMGYKDQTKEIVAAVKKHYG